MEARRRTFRLGRGGRSVPLIVGVGTGAATAVGLTAEVFGLSAWVRVALVAAAAVIAGSVAAAGELLFIRLDERRATADERGTSPGPQQPDSPRQLPPVTRHFVGREDARASLVAELTRSEQSATAVVTISGKGGVGKTALALQLGHTIAPHYPDGQLFARLRDPDGAAIPPPEVLTAFLDALGVDEALIPEQMSDRVRLYNSRLAGRRVLIVLDSALDESQVRPLIPVTPTCAVIVTSRPPLEGLIDATHVWLDVPSIDEGVEMLARVAGRERVDAELDAARQIVRLVGALPLAVRVAGARLRARPFWRLADLAARLRDSRQRLAELAAGDLDVRATLGLSYADTDEADRRAFRLLAIHRGASFGAWNAAALLDVSVREATDVVESLERVRLIESAFTDSTGMVRFRFHDLIRAFALERLYEEEPAADRAAAMERLATAYLTLADEACRHDEHSAAAAGERGWPVRFVSPGPRWHADDPDMLRVSRANPPEWYEIECRPIARLVRPLIEIGRADIAWELAAMLAAHIDAVSGFWDRWEETFQRALDAAAQAARRDGEAALHYAYGAYLTDGDWFAEAAEQFLAALTLVRDLDERSGEARTLTRLGEAMRLLGRFAEAERYLIEARDLARKSGDRLGEASALHDLGGIHRWRHDYAEEERCQRQFLNIARELGLRAEEGRALRKLCAVTRLQGRLTESAAHGRDALAIFDSLNHARWRGRTQLSLGQTRLAQGRLSDAEHLVLAAHTAFEETGSRGLAAEAAKTMARVRLADGGLDAAAEWAQRCLTARRSLGQRLWEGQALRVLGEIRLRQGRFPEARQCLDEAIEALGDYDDPWEQADARRVLAAVDRAVGDHDAALAGLADAARVFRSFGDARAEVAVLTELAEVHRARGDRDAAREITAQVNLLERGLREPAAG